MKAKRIAIGGFLHESNSFAPRTTGWQEFLNPGDFSPLQRPTRLIEAMRPTSAAMAGAIMEAEEKGVTLAPLVWCSANPAGPVTEEAFERITALIVSTLSDALECGPIDGVYLDLHGAMMAVGFYDAEAELLRRIRALVGLKVPIAASLDPHANMTAEMVELSDVLVPFRTYPHIDMKAVGGLAMRLLLRMIDEEYKPAKIFRELDFCTSLPSQCTMVSPMAEIMADRGRLGTTAGIWELGFCFGFPYADFPGCGMSIASYADTPDLAEAAAIALAGFIARKEPEFATGIVTAAEGVSRAVACRGNGPVVLADTQDNPGGGGHGDTTGLLAELIRMDAQGAVLAPMNDAESAAVCHMAGEGARITLDLGGKSDGAPLRVEAVVEKLSNGRFTLSGPMGRGNPANLGPSALIRVAPGVQVVVVSRKMQGYDQELFRHIGVEPARQAIVAVKSSVHFRAHFQSIASEVIVVAAPGPVVADPSELPFTNLRPGLRLRPDIRV